MLKNDRSGALVRPATGADEPALAALYERVASVTFAYDYSRTLRAEQYAALVRGEDVWVLELAGEIIGFAGYYAPEHFLHSLYISYDQHRKGYGRQMLQFLLEHYGHAHDLKVDRINGPALQFYRRMGYAPATLAGEESYSWVRLRSPTLLNLAATAEPA